MGRIIAVILCFLFESIVFNQLYAQRTKDAFDGRDSCCDTILCGSQSLVINIPRFSFNHKSIYQYEEGFFVTYPFKDSAYLFIHQGYNSVRPFCDTTQVKLVLKDDIKLCRYGSFGNLFTKEIYYKKGKITISYVNVKRDELPFFDSIISSLQILAAPSSNR